MKKKKGFSLAEVLITLTIIGIIAAITIPSILQSTQKKEFIIAWRKSFSIIANVVNYMRANGEDDFKNEDTLCRTFAQYVKQSKICREGKFVEDGCAPEAYPIYYKYGTRRVHSQNMGEIGGGSSCILVDNASIICFDSYIAMVDVNGYKGPNTIGQDIFAALIDFKDITLRPAKGRKYMWGPADGHVVPLTAGDGTCQKEDLGWGCSAWYLTHDN